MLQSHGISYTTNELLAIKLHDGLYDPANEPYLKNWMPEQKPRTSLVYILPAYQYSAIWGNPHITALFFLLFSIYFFLKLENLNYKITKYFYYSVIFLALAAYTKQFYVFLFPFLLWIYYRETQFILFIKIIIFTFLLSLPGVFFLLKN